MVKSTQIPARVDSAGHPQRIESIDGLRAIAILLVIVDHYLPWITTGGGAVSLFARELAGWAGTGVDLFFVLSGFLITGILVDSKGSPGYFQRFYWRRSLRIFPAYYALLVPLLFVSRLFTHVNRLWFVFYLRNWRGPDPASDGTLGHLWSLAVEEQFYIVWAVAVFLIAARHLPRITLLLIAAAPAVRAAMHVWGYAGYLIFRVTPARMDSLLLGALVALAVRSVYRPNLGKLARIGLGVSICGLVLTRVLAGPPDVDSTAFQVILPSLSPLLYTSVLALCLDMRTGSAAHTALTNAFFRIVAKYSYAIYLFHLLVGRRVFELFVKAALRYPALDGPLVILFLPVAFGVVFAAAAISWRIIEGPALKHKDKFFGSPARHSAENPVRP